MYNHAPTDYICPICIGLKGETQGTLMRATDIVYQDEVVTAFIGSYFIGQNDGHIIVVPNHHFENIYDLPDDIGAHIFKVSRQLTLALKKAYSCQGITTQQNNEPDGGQHAFHYHLHLFPRYTDDNIFAHMTQKRETTAEERRPFAEKIRDSLSSTDS